ncbi:MAG: sensor domain-containing protein [Panacagrimonas sp.]
MTTPAILSAILIAVGTTVISGWIFRIPMLIQPFPGYISMTINTAQSLLAMGLAILLGSGANERKLQSARLLAYYVFTLAALNLVQVASGRSLGINLPRVHGWMADGNPFPGQMAMPTSIELILATISFVLIHSPAVQSPGSRRIARAASAVMLGIALVALVGYFLQLEALYSWYAYSRMAMQTAACMAVLALALWFRQSQVEGGSQRSVEGQIVAVGTWTLILVALVAGMTGVAILRSEADRRMAEGLHQTHRARMDAVLTVLETHATRGELVASRPGIQALLRSLVAEPAPGMPVTSATLDQLKPFGFRDIRLLSAGGIELAGMGQRAAGAGVDIRVGSHRSNRARLIWQGGFVLLQAIEIRDETGLAGIVETEQPLAKLDQMLNDTDAFSDQSETELCGRSDAAGLICFPNRSHAAPYVAAPENHSERSALLDASRGETGTGSFFPRAAGRRIAAYSPVGSSGLFAATSRDSANLFAPLRDRLILGLGLVLLVTTAGTVILRRSIRPLIDALAETERRYRAVVDNLQEGVLLQDENSAILASNPAAARIFRLPPDELEGMVAGDPRWKVFNDDGTPCPREDYPTPKALRTGLSARDVPYGVVDGHGQLRWIEVTTTLIPTQGPPIVVTTFSDITEKRLASQRLELSESRFQLMVSQVVDYAILMLDADGRVVTWNQGAEQIKGYTAQEAIGMHFSIFYTAEDQECGLPAEHLREAAQTGRLGCESWRVRKDGSRFWGMTVLGAVRGGAGEILGYSKLTRDLTEQRQAAQVLAEAGRRMQAMIDCSPFGIVAIDLQGIIRNMNPAGQRMTGYSSEELVGKLTCAVYHDMDEVRERARQISEETGRHVEPGLETFVYKARLGQSDEQEWICVRKDGFRFPMQATVTALRDTQGVIVGFMGVAYDITERKQREAHTRHVAHHDFLTGLPTRRLMSDRVQSAVENARRDSAQVGLLMIDLDNFKRINDSLGHPVGDELLQVVAERLLGSVRSGDTVARMGGDEFLVVLPNIGNRAVAERLAGRLVTQIGLPIQIGPNELHVSPSIGIAVFPEDSTELTGLLKGADAAMYAAKIAGRACYRSFSRQMQRGADEQLALESDLRQALRRGELDIHYQHQFSLTRGEMIGMEALLRWTHPQRGSVPAERIITTAEKSGLILPLSQWVLLASCKAARRIQQRTGLNLRLAVNLSAQQFRSPELPTMIAAALSETGLDPRCLELEITEGSLMDDAEKAIERFDRIRRTGVQIAIDDFGTGQSSLSYITRFPLDTIKIDRSFVQRLPGHMGDAAVVRSIVELSRSLGIRVVVEGVEHANQLDFLRSRNGDADQAAGPGSMLARGPNLIVQGYYFGQPLNEADFIRSLTPGAGNSEPREAICA